jgi:putative transferase (TIGR04331 family)
MEKKFLVTTAHKDTWKSEESLLFLGKWCLLYNDKINWEKLNYDVANYHWDDREKFHNDYRGSITLMDKFIPILSASLNKIHGVDKSEKYWRIIIAPWLGYFIQIMLDRWFMVNYAYSSYNISDTIILDVDPKEMIPYDVREFGNLITSDIWNHYIFSKIIEFKGFVATHKKYNSSKVEAIKKPKSARKHIHSILYKINYFLTKNNKLFFIDYPLGKKQIVLDAMLGQLTNIQKSNKYYTNRKCEDTSSEYLFGSYNPENEFEYFLTLMISNNFPISYLDGYKSLIEEGELSGWPLNPKVIICSSSHNSNEIFKVWAAEKLENNNTKLVIAQHGGTYGTAKWSFFEDLELRIANMYFSWGWYKESYDNIYPVPSMKIDRYKKQLKSYKKDGKLLVITSNLPRYSSDLSSYPVSSQMEGYFDSVINLVKIINNDIFRSTVIRLDPSKNFSWYQKDRWLDVFEDISFDSCSETLYKSINNSRLVIGTFNSTTILETMAANVPTIIYLNCEHFEVRDSAKKYFTMLKTANILHCDEKSAAKFVNKTWNNIEDWWNNEIVQYARKSFCQQYARTSNNALLEWKNALLKVT